MLAACPVHRSLPGRLRNLAMNALMDLITALKTARQTSRTDEEFAPARDFQRKTQFYLDFVEAENSMGFHAPQEAATFSLNRLIFRVRARQCCVPCSDLRRPRGAWFVYAAVCGSGTGLFD